MKKIFAVFAVLVATAVMLVACGGSSGGGAPAPTKVTTVEQGAQTAVVGSSAATNVVSSAFSLSSNIGIPSGPAPKFGKASKASKALGKRVARYAATAKKAKAAVVKKATQTTNCADGGTWTLTYNDAGTSFSMSESNCKEYGNLYNSNWTMSCGDSACNSINMSGSDTGTSYVQDYTTAAYEYTTVQDKWSDTGSMTFSVNAAGDTYSMTMNDSGWTENFVDSPTWKEEYADSGLTVKVSGSLASQTAYNISIAINGLMSWKYSEAGVVVYGESMTYGNLTVAETYDSTAGTEQFSIDGTLTIDLTPNDTCAEGTFVFDTVTPITFNYNTGMYTAGKLVINTLVVVTYNADGTVNISIDGGTTSTPYTDQQLDALCASL